jgi:hypothetical protein
MPIGTHLSNNSQYETLFHASSIDLHVPETSSLPQHAASSSSSLPPISRFDHTAESSTWWKKAQYVTSRQVAFLGQLASVLYMEQADMRADEKLFYIVSMHIPHAAVNRIPWTPDASPEEPPSELLNYLARLQVR